MVGLVGVFAACFLGLVGWLFLLKRTVSAPSFLSNCGILLCFPLGILPLVPRASLPDRNDPCEGQSAADPPFPLRRRRPGAAGEVLSTPGASSRPPGSGHPRSRPSRGSGAGAEERSCPRAPPGSMREDPEQKSIGGSRLSLMARTEPPSREGKASPAFSGEMFPSGAETGAPAAQIGFVSSAEGSLQR